ncbi:MAG: hypothetical protein J6A21_12805 [Lentisphaeria bacterium]|nr:hypothetical protein [Lentisphaeria bacterium]
MKFDFDAAWEALCTEGLPESFTFGEVFDSLVKYNHGNLPADREEVFNRIAETLLGEERYFLKGTGEEGYAVSRKSFFAGASFKILPSADEIEKGFLLCGARFVPFAPAGLFEGEYTLSSADEPAKKVRTKHVSGPFARFCRPYLLLGKSETIDTLAAESPENYEELRNVKSLDKANVSLTVYDMASFYKKHSFKTGDGILVKIADWEEGKYVLEYCPAKDLPGEEAKEKFLASFEEAVAKVYHVFGEYQLLCDQIAYAYFFASEGDFDLRKNPALSLDEYPSRMRDIAVNRDEAEWYLMPMESEDFTYADTEESFHEEESASCSCGHDHHHHDHHECCTGMEESVKTLLTPEEKAEVFAHEEGVPDRRIPRHFSLSRGRMDSLEGILDDIQSPVPSMEIYGMMLDFLSNGGEQYEAFLSLLREEMETSFVDEAQETAFVNFLEEVWEDARERFDPVHETTKMGLRSRLLSLTSAHRSHSRKLLHKYQGKVPPETIRKMQSIHGKLMETLGVVDADCSLPEGEDLERLELRIGDLEDEWEALSSSEEGLEE